MSFFEIYGGKLYDLLNDRRKLVARADAKQVVNIVGLQETEVKNVGHLMDALNAGHEARSTAATGANMDSSRSHAVLQINFKRKGSNKGAEGTGEGVGGRRGCGGGGQRRKRGVCLLFVDAKGGTEGMKDTIRVVVGCLDGEGSMSERIMGRSVRKEECLQDVSSIHR